ncbi:MAG: metalloregulator ArsR/SmtB family transcription factor [Oligoflexia bacterium]|nr:metalloregulator ArsR/SmtB family transcription factor [Oligoflexia bacterium]
MRVLEDSVPRAARQFKDAVYEQLARIGKSIGSPRRLELLDLLCQGPRTVDSLAQQAGLSLANASHHLQVLRRARLVDTEKNGVFVTYRLADEEVCAFFLALRALAESRLAEMERLRRDFLAGREGMEGVDRDDLLDRVRRGQVAVIDVRPRDEYRAGHIPGALSVPLDELERHLADLPRDRQIVAYCRGPYCVLAVEAVERLRAAGYRAIRMEDGVVEWRARGLDLEPAASATPQATETA